jgi:hypothetical protein
LYRPGLIAALPTAVPDVTSLAWEKADADRLTTLLTTKFAGFNADAKAILTSPARSDAERKAALSLSETLLSTIHSAVEETVPKKSVNTQRKATGKPSFLRDASYRSLMRRRLRLLKKLNERLTAEDREQKQASLRTLNALANARARLFLRKARVKDWRDAEFSYRKLRTSRTFWSKLHRLRKGKTDSSSRPITDTVLDANGKICSGAEDVLKVWQEYFQKTYWVAPSTDARMLDEEKKMQERIEAALRANGHQRHLDGHFSDREVEAVIEASESGKAPGEDNLPYEFFKRFFHKDVSATALAALTAFFNLLLTFSIWPDEFSRGIIAPIYKRKGNRLEPNVFRPISLLLCLSKLYELLLNNRLSKHVEANNVLCEEQAGFRSDRSTLDHILTLDTIITTSYERKEPIYAAFLDIEKAYDRTWRLRLLTKLLDAGVTGRVFRSIHAMLKDVHRSVRIGTRLSDWFLTNCGVPQGSILSPILFDIFVNDIIEDVNELEEGVALGDRRVSCLLYADDIVLLSHTPEGLQRMLDACQKFATKARFKFNVRKSNIVLFSRDENNPRPTFYLNNERLEYADFFTYLGIEFGHYVYGRKHTRWDLYIKRILKEGERRSHEVLKIARERDSQSGLPVHLTLLYYFTHVRSRLEFACQVWGPMITAKQRKKLDMLQDEFARNALHLPDTTASTFCLGELDVMPLSLRHEELALRMWGNICTMAPTRLPRIAQLQYLQRSNQATLKSTWFHTIYRLISKKYPSLAPALSGLLPTPLNARAPDTDAQSKTALIRRAWSDQVTEAVRNRWTMLWSHEISELSSLRFYRVFKQQPALEPWLKDTNHSGIHAKLLLRAGLLLNTSHPRPNGNKPGHCYICDQRAAETRSHFLLTCPALEHLRQEWARDLKSKMTPDPHRPDSLAILLNQWVASAHVDLAPSPTRPTFVSPSSHSTVQICSLLHPAPTDDPRLQRGDDGNYKAADGIDDEQAQGILKTRRKFETLLEKSTRILLHKMTKLRQQLTAARGLQYHPLH